MLQPLPYCLLATECHPSVDVTKVEDRPQWSKKTWWYMESLFQLQKGNRSIENTRTLRGLLSIVAPNGKMKKITPYIHQLYCAAWMRQRAYWQGGAINGDDPGFGKVRIYS